MRAYTAGPITGFSYGEVTAWREIVAKALNSVGIDVYSPLRGKSYLEGLGPLSVDADTHADGVHVGPKGVMVRDHLDCTRADIVIAYLPESTRPSLGTVMEISWAFDRRIPVVAVTPKDSLYFKHPMISEAISYRVDTIEQAITIAIGLVRP